MFTVTMLFLVLQIVFVVSKVNHALSGKSVLQMRKLNSRTDQTLAANAVDHFFWRKDPVSYTHLTLPTKLEV